MKFFSKISFLLAIMVASNAFGAADEERKVEFLGFSSDSRQAMLKIVDPNSGNKIAVLGIPKGKRIAAKAFYSGSQVKKIKDSLAKKYHVSDPGKNAMVDPGGKVTFFGLVRGKYFVIMAMRGNRTAIFNKIPAGKATNIVLKEIWWASDGRSMAVIINKKKTSPDYGFDIDTVRFYRYYPSTLRFK